MKLIVIAVGKLPPGRLSRWSRDPDCIVVTTRPVHEGGDDWSRAPIEMTSKVSLSERQTRLFEPWFDLKSESTDLRLPGAEIGFIEAANSQLFFQVWNCLGLLLDLERNCPENSLSIGSRFVTDGAQQGRMV